jgi:hypothetical protein
VLFVREEVSVPDSESDFLFSGNKPYIPLQLQKKAGVFSGVRAVYPKVANRPSMKQNGA